MNPTPLSREDRAILELECAEVAGHTAKVFVIDGPAPSLEEVGARIEAGLESAPALTRKLGGDRAEPSWVDDPSFDLSRQLRGADRPPLEDAELAGAVAELFAQRLDRALPLWRLDRLPMTGERCALVWRLHHALADGTAAVRYARALLFDPPTEIAPTPAATGSRGRAAAADDAEARRRGHLVAMIQREFGESLAATPFAGEIGSERAVGFADLPLRELHDAAREIAGATLNDAVLAVVGGAVERWISERHGAPESLRVRVPVSLHEEGDDAANHDSFFTLPVPIGGRDPVGRLRTVAAATAARKRERDAGRIEALHTALAPHPVLADLVDRIEASPRSFALCVSNVRGPAHPVAIAGRPVERAYTLAEIGRRHGLRVAVLSTAGTLSFGLTTDPGIVEGVDLLADSIRVEAEALIDA